MEISRLTEHDLPAENKETKSIYLDGTYLARNATWDVEDSPWKAKQIYSILLKNGLKPKTLGEVGCGAGEILRQLSLKMPETKFYGYELSPHAFELCRSRVSESISYALSNIEDEEVFFDVLLCIDVFEHVDDYLGFIKALKPKATYKIFHIPLDIHVSSVLRGSMMKARHSVGHLHYFTPETALATLTDSGYEIIDSFYTTPFHDLPAKTLKAALAKLPRKILYALSPKLTVRLIGGCSLLVLTK